MSLLPSCSGPAGDAGLPEGTPVVLVSLDTLRSDRIGAYGDADAETPHLDRFAAEAILFERAYAHCPMTLPSHTSVFTGLLPPAHGVRDNLEFALPDGTRTLAARMREIGYRTEGAVSSMVLRASTGIAQGFDRYDDTMPPLPRDTARRFAERRGDATVAVVERWLRDPATTASPFFLFVHLFDPHTPYEAPEPYASRHAHPYDAEVAWTDSLVGRLFDALREAGVYDRALIVVFSDHGEGLGDHVERQHGMLLYRETIQTALMVRLPGGRSGGTRVAEPVGLVDIAPTILGRLGADASDLPGIDLLDTAARAGRAGVYSEALSGRIQFGWAALRSVVQDRWHYIESPDPELYDVVADPAETDDRIDREDPLPSMLDVLATIGTGSFEKGSITEAERERLASLGYVGGFSGETSGEAAPNPNDRIADVVELFEQVDAMGRDPSLAPERRALELLRGLGVDNEPIARTAATNLLGAGRIAEAHEAMAPFRDTGSPASLDVLGRIAVAEGDLDRALVFFRRLVEVAPDDGRGPTGIGITFLTAERPVEAEPWLQRAVALDPGAAEAWNGLAVIRASRGDLPGAVEAWNAAVAADPEFSDAWYNLGVVLRRMGNDAEAERAMRRYRALEPGA